MLDLSFNQIRVIEGLDGLPQITELYFVNNKITEISSDIAKVPTLTLLELGANRIRVS